MAKFRYNGTAFLTGLAVAALVVVALAAAGVVPTRVVRTTVKTQVAATSASSPAASAAATTATALTTTGLTPSQIYREYAAGVVEVLASFTVTADQGPWGPQSTTVQSLGSGFVATTDGYILTNAHVVSDSGTRASTVTVAFKGTGTTTKRVTATIVGIDESSDVAVLKVDPAKSPGLVTIPLGDSSAVQVGETVVAIGNPLGYDFSLTEGIVSATSRELTAPNGATIKNGVQTDAAINKGNSGGPLIDSSGHVIGINEQIATESGGNEGLGFALPINTAAAVLQRLTGASSSSAASTTSSTTSESSSTSSSTSTPTTEVK
jgi:S1-C subfamily serine protease